MDDNVSPRRTRYVFPQRDEGGTVKRVAFLAVRGILSLCPLRMRLRLMPLALRSAATVV